MSIGSVGSNQSSVIEQLLYLEAQPKRDLESKVSNLDVRLGVLSDLRSKINAFKSLAQEFARLGSTSALRRFKATSSQDSVMTATAGSTAAPGNHTLTVASLAQAHTIASGGFTGTGTGIAAGSYAFEIEQNGVTTQVTVEIAAGDDNAAAMQKVVDAIRSSGAEVTASLVTVSDVTDTRRIVLAAKESGTGAIIARVEDTAGGLMTQLGLAGTSSVGAFSSNTTLEGRDAAFTLDGLAMTSSSNQVEHALEGIVFSLKSTTATPVTLQVAYDQKAVQDKLQQMLDAYNGIVDYLNTKLQSGDENGVGRGELAGELTFIKFRSTLIHNVVRAVDAAVAQSGINSLDDVGLSLGRDGKLSLADAEAFFGALTSTPEAVETFFGSDDGIATRLDDLVRSFTKIGGGLDLARDLVESKKDVLNMRIERMESFLAVREQQLRSELGRLSQFISQLNFQQSLSQGLMTTTTALFLG
jgi:flagellar hook-associated protein 2